jgi:hypothetical protein
LHHTQGRRTETQFLKSGHNPQKPLNERYGDLQQLAPAGD